MSCLTACVQINQSLIAAASKSQRDVLQFLYKATVYQYVQQSQHFLGCFTMAVASWCSQFLISEATEAPDVFLGIGFPNPAQKGKDIFLIGGFKWFSAKQSQAVDIIRL